MIWLFIGLKPVVSISKTTYVPARLWFSECSTISFRSSTKYPSHPYNILNFPSVSWFATGKAATFPWSVIAMAVCPHSMARLIISFTSATPSISLIFVWQWSSTLFSTAVSMRFTVKSLHFLIPTTDPTVSSPSNRSIVVTPLSFTNAPGLTCGIISGSCSFLANIFTVIVSVKSVTSKIKIVFSPRISLVSSAIIFPRITSSPISVWICSIGVGSSSKSLP